MSGLKWQELNLETNETPEIDVELDEKISVVKAKEDDEIETKEPESEDNETTEPPVRRRKRYSRAQSRIRELVADNKNLREQLERGLKENKEEIQNLQNISTAATELGQVKSQLIDLQSRLAKAHEDQNWGEVARLNVEINKSTVKEAILTVQSKVPTKETKATIETLKQPEIVQETPEVFQDWASDKDWLQEPETRHEKKLQRYVRKAARELEEDGYDFNEDDFYEELDKKITEYVTENELDIEGYKKTKKPKEKEKTSPSAPTSRSSNVSRRDGKTVVRLTAEQRQIAKQFNLTDEEYAKELVKLEGKSNGYTNI